MKQFILLTSLFLCSLGLSAQVYVDADATGAGDGTSWADAYTSLNDAIIAADAGASLWVAEGTYTTPDSTAFFIDKQLTVLGGFSGTETNPNDADPAANVTILNGDVAGDDAAGTFDSLTRVDNNRIIVALDDDGADFTVTIDGFTLMNGSAPQELPTDTLANNAFAGGAIHTTATMIGSRLVFMNNFAETGSNIYVQGASASGSRFTDISSTSTFTFNTPFVNVGHAFAFITTDDLVIDGLTFSQDDANDDLVSGVVNIFRCGDVTLSDATFTGLFFANEDFFITNADGTITNANTAGRCVTSFDNVNVLISNTSFTDIQSEATGTAGILSGYLAAAGGRPVNPTECVVDNCTFDQVFAGRGPAFRAENSSFVIKNSSFNETECVNSNLGGAIYAFGNRPGEPHTFVVDSSTINDATSTAFGGGGIWYFLSDDETALTTNSTFTDCHAGVGGGIMYYDNGFGEVRNCIFRGNGGDETDFRGAGMAIWTFEGMMDSALVVDNCTFENNETAQEDNIVSGGSLYVTTRGHSSPQVFVKNTQFLNNSMPNTSGAGIYTINGARIDMQDVDFIGNRGEAGGAINNTTFLSNVFSVSEDNDTINFVDQPLYEMTGNKVMFYLNTVTGGENSQGGAIDFSEGSTVSTAAAVRVPVGADNTGSKLTFQNSIFAANSVDPDGGSGGAIIINGSTNNAASSQPEINFYNNTFYANRDGGREAMGTQLKSGGDHIAVFQPGTADQDSNGVTITLLNNVMILVDGGDENIGVEAQPSMDDPLGFGVINVNSLGGNFFNAAATVEDLVFNADASDIVDTDVEDGSDLFVDPDNDEDELVPNFRLICDGDNILIDGGAYNDLVTSASFYDIPRGAPDVGAAEADPADCALSTAEPIEESGLNVTFFPNPTADRMNIQNNETSFDRFSVIVFDMNGRVMGSRQFTGVNNTMDFGNLPAGTYNLQLIVGDNAYSKQIVKQ